MIHHCVRCGLDTTAVSPTGLHDADQGGCGNPVTAVVTPAEVAETWLDRHWYRLAMVGLGCLMAAVCVWGKV